MIIVLSPNIVGVVIGFEQMMYTAVEGDVNTIQTIRVVLVSGSLRRSVGVRVFTDPDTAMGTYVYHSVCCCVCSPLTSDLVHVEYVITEPDTAMGMSAIV